jgi:hypothetical protein
MFGFSTQHAAYLAKEANEHGRVLTQEERAKLKIPGFVPRAPDFSQLVNSFCKALHLC